MRKVEGPKQGHESDIDALGASVRMKIPTEGERRSVSVEMQDVSGGNFSLPSYRQFQADIIKRFVVSVSDYEVSGVEIKTASDLLEYGETTVIDFVFEYIIAGRSLSEEEEKN